MITAFVTLLGIGFLAGLINFVTVGLISFRLEKHHPSVIRRFDAVSTPTSQSLARFVWTGEYRILADPPLTRLIVMSRTAVVVLATCVLAGAV